MACQTLSKYWEHINNHSFNVHLADRLLFIQVKKKCVYPSLHQGASGIFPSLKWIRTYFRFIVSSSWLYPWSLLRPKYDYKLHAYFVHFPMNVIEHLDWVIYKNFRCAFLIWKSSFLRHDNLFSKCDHYIVFYVYYCIISPK